MQPRTPSTELLEFRRIGVLEDRHHRKRPEDVFRGGSSAAKCGDRKLIANGTLLQIRKLIMDEFGLDRKLAAETANPPAWLQEI